MTPTTAFIGDSKRSRSLSNRDSAAGGFEHRLKCWPEFFEPIKARNKTHDLRRSDDREFRVGDRVLLEEYDPEKRLYTGRKLVVRVTYITSSDLPCALSKDALHPDFCILSIALCE
jgi:Domain of unknown function (DUF3850)